MGQGQAVVSRVVSPDQAEEHRAMLALLAEKYGEGLLERLRAVRIRLGCSVTKAIEVLFDEE